ncbi:hypothetical protein FDH27_gp017 [Vibrio phage SSP002]|uniref:Lipoprotein n=1 Tax=Vibrio phage SSP002 TaxID=1161928 RepID=H9EB17_9CAUD|nr:hypothetical protein FDH27_gp017 [Vibrio phage SSP002]AFE86344.1 hypothetical protein SSP002_017 [Vibrio phage SSP002]
MKKLILVLAITTIAGCASPERLHNLKCDQWVYEQVMEHGEDYFDAVKECGYKKIPMSDPLDGAYRVYSVGGGY